MRCVPFVCAAGAIFAAQTATARTDFQESPPAFTYQAAQTASPKNIPITLPKFDSQGGTRLLKRVDIQVDLTAFLSVAIENNLAGEQQPTGEVTVNGGVDFPTGVFADTDSFNDQYTPPNPLGPAGGGQNQGTDYFDFGDVTVGPLSFATTLLGTPATLAAFVGPGDLTGNASVELLSSGGGSAFNFYVEGPGGTADPNNNTPPEIGANATVTYYWSFATGACCLPTGACVQTDPDDCSNQGGIFRGPDTLCANANCPGACCLPNGNCTVTDATLCLAANGTYIGGSCAAANCTPPGCECYWSNGDHDGMNAVVSETNVTVPPSETADDFVVPDCYVLFADRLCGCMVTNDLESQNGNFLDTPDAIAYFYEDCNGKPGDQIGVLTDPNYTILGNAPFGAPGQWKYVRFCFENLDLILNGGRYWVSFVGVGDNQPGERYFWATSKTSPTDEIQGTQGQLRSNWVDGFLEWRDVDDTNAGCHDFCFELCGDLCETLYSNFPGAVCGVKALNTTFFGTKAADNFEIQPCYSAEICQIAICIATNCTPSRSKAQIFRNSCDSPSDLVRLLGDPRVVPMDGTFTSPVTGIALPMYCLFFRIPAESPLLLPGGQNYWLAAYLEGTGVITEEAYVVCRADEPCNIKITQAQFIASPFDVNDWQDIDAILPYPTDLAIQIWGNVVKEQPVAAPHAMPYPLGGLQQGTDIQRARGRAMIGN